MGIIQHFKSRFRITTNGGQCISCGNYSTYCEQGIDLRAYAQKGENIVRSSCVGCGIWTAVYPRSVLKLENAQKKGRIKPRDILLGNNVDLIQLVNERGKWNNHKNSIQISSNDIRHFDIKWNTINFQFFVKKRIKWV